ncbi:kinase-like protein [Ceratobasidium sp. AG-I]|nr:kinase-like protein [Ceratobasidium sp. AG-I]
MANITFMSPSFFVRAIYNYHPDHPDKLSLSRGDIIEVLTKPESGWWDGLVTKDHGYERGWFPSNFVVVISQAQAKTALGKHWAAHEPSEPDGIDIERFEDAPELDDVEDKKPNASEGIKSGNPNAHQTKQKPLPQTAQPMVLTKPAVSKLNGGLLSKAAISKTMPASEVIRHLVEHNCSDITDHLDLSQCSNLPIAGGGFGDIYWGALNDGSSVAIKCVRSFFGSDADDSKPLKHTARELYTWSKCRHDNVLELLGVAQFRYRIAMVSPWMDNGALPNYLAQKPSVDRYQLCTQIASGLMYLHEMGTVHGDMKAYNVLISDDGTAKIADFGSTILKEYTLQFTDTTTSSGVSMRWAAPELLEGKTLRSFEADVYALGMTLLEIVTGLVPFHDKSDPAVMYAVGVKRTHPSRPDSIPAETQRGDALWSLLLHCWNYEPEARPRAGEVLNAMKSITGEAPTA